MDLSRTQSNFAGAMSRAEPGSDQAKILAIYKALPLRSDKKRDIIKKWTEDIKIRYENIRKSHWKENIVSCALYTLRTLKCLLHAVVSVCGYNTLTTRRTSLAHLSTSTTRVPAPMLSMSKAARVVL